MFDYSNPAARQSFAARYDSLNRNDPVAKSLAKADLAVHHVGELYKLLTRLSDRLNTFTGRNTEAARAQADMLVKMAGVHREAMKRNEAGLTAKAQGVQPPLAGNPWATTQSSRERAKAFMEHFWSR